MVDAMADGLLFVDERGMATYANPAAERLLGQPAASILRDGPLDGQWRCLRADGTPFPGNEHPLTVARRTGRAVTDVEMGVYRTDNSLVWLSVSATPVLEADGNATGLVTTLSDVTARKVVEQGLRASDAEHRGYFESRALGIAVTDVDGHWVRVNEQLCWMLGLSQAELITAPLEHRLHPEDRPHVEARLREMLRGARSAFEIDVRYVRADGRPVWTLTAVTALVESTAYTTDVMWTVIDIGARKQAEADLRESEARHRALAKENASLVTELRESLANVKTLAALVPVCSWCRKLRSDEGFWTGLEEYLATHADAQVTHGICPDCETHVRSEDKGAASS